MNELRFEQLALGMEASFEAELSGAMIDQFAALSGDQSPLHLDKAFAAALGHPDRVAHGLLSASLFSTLVGVHLPGRHALLHEVKIGFHSPIYPGQRLKISGKISYLNEAFKQAEIKAIIVDAEGKKKVSATIKVGLTA